MNARELLDDINTITMFYKTTPIVPLITNILQTYYNIYQKGAIRNIEKFSSICDFAMSNLATKLQNKTIDGKKVIHFSNVVSPHKASKLYSICSYGDEITMNMSYIQGMDIKVYRECVNSAYKWYTKELEE